MTRQNAEGPSQGSLLALAKNGDTQAQEALLSPLANPLARRIRLMMGRATRREADTLDLVQDVQVRALEALPDFRGSGDGDDFLRWLTTIARNRLRDLGRRQRLDALESMSITLPASASTTGDPVKEIERAEAVVQLVEAIAEMPADYRTVIELRDLEGKSFNEVAVEMERTSNAVRLLHTRALVKLGKSLDPQAES